MPASARPTGFSDPTQRRGALCHGLPSLITDCAVDIGTARAGVEGECRTPSHLQPAQETKAPTEPGGSTVPGAQHTGQGRSSGTGGVPCCLLPTPQPCSPLGPGPPAPPLARTHCRPSPDPGPLWSRCVRAQVPGFGAICQHSPLFLSKALSATSLRSHLASKVHMPKRLKTTQSVPSRVAVIRQSQSPSSRFRQGAGKASTLKPPCRGPRASPSSSGRPALHPPYLGKPGIC